MEGWIKLHRALLEWEWFQDTITLHVFVYILLRATPLDTTYKGIKVERGCLITSVRKIGEDTHIPEKRVRSAIQRLAKSKQIIIKATNKFSYISICNYENYQESEKTKGQTKGKQRGDKGRAGGQSKGEPTEEEYKNIDISNDISSIEGKNSVAAPVAAQPPATEVKAIRTLEDREREFMQQVAGYSGTYPGEMLDSFAAYWSEPNKSRTKLKFELEKTWDLSRRLSTWAKNELKFSGAGPGRMRRTDSTGVLNALVGNI